MNKPGTPRSRWRYFGGLFLKGLLLYVLPPLLCLLLLAQPIGNTVRGSGAAAFWILLAALGAVCLNWLVYASFRRERPSLLIFAWGIFCLLLVIITEYEALLNHEGPASTLAVIGGCLALALLLLISFWLASRRSKAAHSAAVVLWVIIGFAFVFMLYQVLRDFETETATADTWITAAVLAAFIPAAFLPRILSSFQRRKSRRRADGLAEGRIMQIIGETRLDRDDDLVTNLYALIRYSAEGAEYETRTGASKMTVRRYGRKFFVGQKIPVHYDPERPEDAYTGRIDRKFAKELLKTREQETK